ncbi:hypothetical protein H7U32_01185 [Bifidobacterium pullorum subsp. saeculare]|uniref:Lipoprotein n=1 Tax=Bifidobacterium pullorum subsp. saeculare TaxID=78257 RepID=A0A939B9L4_9BIFI|nr:hypothetical protein [Bifidobacterium pullorum]MBM6698961.1 hypothetical protein [Bifidobacterium pullorum subsp. saeculare]
MRSCIIRRALVGMTITACLVGLSACEGMHDTSAEQRSVPAAGDQSESEAAAKRAARDFTIRALTAYEQAYDFDDDMVPARLLGKASTNGNSDIPLRSPVGAVGADTTYYVAYLCKQPSQASFSLSLKRGDERRRLILHEACMGGVESIEYPVSRFPDATSLSIHASDGTRLVIAMYERTEQKGME